MTNVTPANSVVWFEIPVTDMKRAKSFYNAVFLTDLQEDNTGPNPMAMFPVKDMKTGNSGHLYPGKPASGGSGNTVHLAAPAPLEDALVRVAKNGGKVISEIVDIPPGRFAYCLDPDGNSIGVFVHH
jgi:predicted enzyme related to lactoylglutathione lyase